MLTIWPNVIGAFRVLNLRTKVLNISFLRYSLFGINSGFLPEREVDVKERTRVVTITPITTTVVYGT